MKKKIASVIVILILAIAASGICVGEQFKTFSEKGISFDYPEEWFRVGFTWEPEPEWGVCLSAGTGNEPGVFVLRFLLDDKTLEEFANESRGSVYGTGFTTTSPAKTTINGLLAYTYHYAGTKYGESVEGDTMVLTADGVKVYWVDGFATKAEYSENKANFQRVFESFRIGDGTPTPQPIHLASTIETDKFEYYLGETIAITIEIGNPTEDNVTFQWYWGVPQYSIWVPVMSEQIPAGYNETLNFNIPSPCLGLKPSCNVFYVQLLDASEKVLDADATCWTCNSSGVVIPSVGIAEQISQCIDSVKSGRFEILSNEI